MNRRTFVRSAAALTSGVSISHSLPVLAELQDAVAARPKAFTIRADVVSRQLPHVWEACIGSDRASVGMRAQWLDDLDRIHKEVGAQSVRFHGLFSDEMGVWPVGAKGPNFLYVDMVFDAMMARGVKPFVELGFMPGGLASGTQTIFFYKANVTPPKEMAHWSQLISAFAQHCIDRYGASEVTTWNFEVWNEANLPYFWSSTKEAYFDLFRAAALALKGVDPRLRVGGPSTARASWVADLLKFCEKQEVPIDFVSTHIYPDDPQDILFEGASVHYPYEEVIPRALEKLKRQIAASKFPKLPLYISEWSSQNPAFIVHTIKGCIGLADIMSYWTFDNVYEELGIPATFMNGGFGLLALRGVPRPSFHTFTLLHRLGDSEVETTDGPLLATRRKDGSLAILLWNLSPRPPGQRSATGDPTVQTASQYASDGTGSTYVLSFEGIHNARKGQITRVDASSGSLAAAYEAIGKPAYPTASQIDELKTQAKLAPPQSVRIDASNKLFINVPPNGIALLELA
jgi:xylan 1,4-beta-xylosidase